MRRIVRTAAVLCARLGVGLVLLTAPQGARAHSISPDEIVARLRTPAAREAFGIEEVARLDGLPRLLLVRVGPRWLDVPVERRREAAEDWGRAWGQSVAQGIVAVVDVSSGDSLVNFDGRGHASLSK